MASHSIESMVLRADRGDMKAIRWLLDRATANADPELRLLANQAFAEADKRVHLNEKDGSVLIDIPEGPLWRFMFKDEIELSAFRMAQHPVTNHQFYTFIQETGYEPVGGTVREFLMHWYQGKPLDALLEHPVVHVSLLDALYYCEWAGVMLPDEWMWEKAAAGAEGRLRPWGRLVASPELANISSGSTKPIGSYSQIRTVYGCQDMIGNVMEWTSSHARSSADAQYGEVFDLESFDEGTARFRHVTAVTRGCGFRGWRTKDATCQWRSAFLLTSRNAEVGFRVASRTDSLASLPIKWGDLRSVCHASSEIRSDPGDPNREESAKLFELEKLLGTWPEEAPMEEVRAYIRHHLQKWRLSSDHTPADEIMLRCFNGRARRTFEALYGSDEGYQSVGFGLLDRCSDAMRRLRHHVRDGEGLRFASFAFEEGMALYKWMSQYAHEKASQLSLWSDSDQGSLLQHGLSSHMMLTAVELPGMHTTFSVIEFDFIACRLSLLDEQQSDLSRILRQKFWSPEGCLRWLQFLGKLVEQAPGLELDFDDYAKDADEDWAQLWALFVSYSGIANEP